MPMKIQPVRKKNYEKPPQKIWKNGICEALSGAKKVLPWSDISLFFQIKKHGIRSRIVKSLESYIKLEKKKIIIKEMDTSSFTKNFLSLQCVS